MTRTFIIESGQKLTKEQLKEVEEARKSPIIFDEDCEELSPAMMKEFKSAVVQRNRKKGLERSLDEEKHVGILVKKLKKFLVLT